MKPLKKLDENNLTDEYLWQQFRMGSRDAFEKIYRSHFKNLYKYGMTIQPDESLVKDAIQELFIDLWKYKQNLSEVHELKFYLLKSLRTKIYKHLKLSNDNSILLEHLKMLQVEHLPSQEILILEDQDKQAKKEKLQFVVNNLPPRQREAILLIFFENRSYEEASRLLAMNIQSLYTLIWRAVSTIKKKLTQN